MGKRFLGTKGPSWTDRHKDQGRTGKGRDMAGWRLAGQVLAGNLYIRWFLGEEMVHESISIGVKKAWKAQKA